MPFDGSHGQSGDVTILLAARSRITGQGHWVKGTFKLGDGWCIVGALSAACASPGFKLPNDTERRLSRKLAKELPWTVRALGAAWYPIARLNLISYNDRPDTSHPDVLALFDRAIAKMAGRQDAILEWELASR